MATTSPLLAVDTPSLMYRAFFALPKTITGSAGTPVNALLGTANLVLNAVELLAPRAVVLCWGAEAAHYRKALYAGYHADRPEMPEELVGQWDDAPDFFAGFGWPSLRSDDLEADDLLGTLSALERQAGGTAVLFTGDRDMFQCVDDQVRVLFPRGGKDGPHDMGADEVRAHAGVEPAQIPDLIALRGDPSDGIPGAKGIGAKGAAELLGRFGDLDGVLAAAAQSPPEGMTLKRGLGLVDQADQLRAYQDMATLRTEPGVTRPADAATDRAGASAAARERGMNGLADRLAAS